MKNWDDLELIKMIENGEELPLVTSSDNNFPSSFEPDPNNTISGMRLDLFSKTDCNQKEDK